MKSSRLRTNGKLSIVTVSSSNPFFCWSDESTLSSRWLSAAAGGDHYETFMSEYEYHTYGDKNERDFYTGHPLITTISEKKWKVLLTTGPPPPGTAGCAAGCAHGAQGLCVWGGVAEPKDRVWLIEFCAPWCTACQRFASGWKETASLMQDDDIEVGGMNCAKDRDMCQKVFNIRAYP